MPILVLRKDYYLCPLPRLFGSNTGDCLRNTNPGYTHHERLTLLFYNQVDIDQAEGVIRVYNDGNGIPVEMHKEEGVYVPELIFGHLLTSSNYDDGEKKVTGGRNGYGAKLANIFSSEFVIETCDGARELRYRQVFRNNMSEKSAPVVTKCKKTDNWTCITFKPDLAKFNMETLEEDTVALMCKRTYFAFPKSDTQRLPPLFLTTLLVIYVAVATTSNTYRYWQLLRIYHKCTVCPYSTTQDSQD